MHVEISGLLFSKRSWLKGEQVTTEEMWAQGCGREIKIKLSDVIASLNADCTKNIVVCGHLSYCPGLAPSVVDFGLVEMHDSFGSGAGRRLAKTTSCYMATTSSTLITRVAVDDAGHIPDHRIVTANVAFRALPTSRDNYETFSRLRYSSVWTVFQPFCRDWRLRRPDRPGRDSQWHSDTSCVRCVRTPCQQNTWYFWYVISQNVCTAWAKKPDCI